MADAGAEQRVRALVETGEISRALSLWEQESNLGRDAAVADFHRRFKTSHRPGAVIDSGAPRTSQATARFGELDQSDMGAYAPGQVWLGRSLTGDPVGFQDDRHIITLAGSRAGKGTSAIVPNLCDYPGSVICVDPKGENATITSRRRGFGSDYCRGMGQKVVVLDPFGIADVDDSARGAFNPMDLIEAGSLDELDQANAIAEAMIVETDPRDAHWNESAKQVLAALLLYVRHEGSAEEQHLGFVRDILSRGLVLADRSQASSATKDTEVSTTVEPVHEGYSGFDAVLSMMRRSRISPVSAMASTLAEMGPEERGGVLSAARRNTAFLDSPRIRSVLSQSTFALEELKSLKGGVTVYLCLPVKELVNHKRWLRLLVMLTLERIERLGQRPPASGHPVLFVLDEFSSLGHMRTLEVAVGFIAGYGVKLWCILQDLAQLQGTYKESWATFLGNAGVIQCFANNDPTTLEYLSKRLGDTEMRQTTWNESRNRSNSQSSSESFSKTSGTSQQTSGDKSITRAPRGLIFRGKRLSESASTSSSKSRDASETRGGSREASQTEGEDEGWSEVISVAPLMRPDEIEREFSRGSGKQLVIVSGNYPISLLRTPYFDDRHFDAKFDPSPAHPDKAPPTLAQREQWALEAEQRRMLDEAETQRALDASVQAKATAKRSGSTPKAVWPLLVAGLSGLALLLGKNFGSSPKTLESPSPVTQAAATTRHQEIPRAQELKAQQRAAVVEAPPAAAPATTPVGPLPDSLPVGGLLVVAAIEANVRAAALPTADRVATVERGMLVRTIARENGFIQLADGSNNGVGWISDRLLMTQEGYERLRTISPSDYVERFSNGARFDTLWTQLSPLTPVLSKARAAMLAGRPDAFAALAAIDQQRSVGLSGADLDAANWYGVNAKLAEGAGRIDEAVTHARAAVVADPSNVDNLVAFALGSFRLSKLEDAVRLAPLIVLLAPQTTNAWLVAGIADAVDNRNDLAVSSFGYGIKLSKNPTFTKKYFLEMANGNVDARIGSALRDAVAANP